MEKEEGKKNGKVTANSVFYFVCMMFAGLYVGSVLASASFEFLSEKTGFFYEEVQSANIRKGLEKATKAATNKVNFKAKKAHKKFTRKYDTTAAWQLDMEYDAYPELNQSHYDTVDRVIDHVKSKIARQKRWAALKERERATIVFTSICDFLKKYRKNSGSEETLISQGFDKKDLDCDTGSVIYLAVGEALGLPIVAVLVPLTSNNTGHMFVRWNDGAYQNWETTTGEFMSDMEFQEWLGSKKLKIEFAVLDKEGYREGWRRQLHYAYKVSDAETLVKSITSY